MVTGLYGCSISKEGGFCLEFSEKLQQLRKQNNLTQEQLGEKLFVSRTAVSKWESGKGYPNIDSLKGISRLFSVSIDDLLSGEELITLAAAENRSYMRKVFNLICGIVDLMAVAFIFLPVYGQPDGAYVRSVSLLEYQAATGILLMTYWVTFLLMVALGIVQMIIQYFENEKWSNISTKCSFVFHAMAILFFAVSRQPYVTMLLFLFFIIKLLMAMKHSKTK